MAAYRAGDHLSENSAYEPRLRDLGADGNGEVLVAVEAGPPGPGLPADTIVGTVMLQPWPHAGQVVTGPDEAEIRALAVLPAAQGTGLGKALLAAVVERARQRGVRHLVLLTQPNMLTAQRMYERAGFAGCPSATGHQTRSSRSWPTGCC